jgi:two-component system alkaline phosphatase synthesis response regulator PhoP
MEKVLLVDDEQDILEFLSYNLKQEGYSIFTANNGKEAIEVAKAETPDLIVLDVMMPEMDGVETCMELRKISELQHCFIIFLTARSEDYSQIAGLEAGADDYLTKPIKPRVFVSKIKALFRRKVTNAKKVNTNNVSQGISIDRERYLVMNEDQEFSLPKKEFELLALLISKPGKVFTRQEILEKIWGEEVIVGDRTIDVHIRKLREKLGIDHIKTVKGVGYKFRE